MEWFWAGIAALMICGVIAALVAIDRTFFGEEDEVEGIPDGSGELSSGKYTKDEIPFN